MSQPEIVANANPPTPFNLMVSKQNPYQVVAFAHGANVLRAALGNSNGDSTLTIAPLRGAMPMVWSAEGDQIHEESTGAQFVEVPLGTFKYQSAKGEGETSPRSDQKRAILRDAIEKVVQADGRTPGLTRLAIVDEVQKGGTLGTAVGISRGLIRDMGFHRELRVYAAQDSRARIVGQEKTPSYRELASNSSAHTPTTVIPMPLVATDRAPMLDVVTLAHGTSLDTLNLGDKLSVKRNVEAERMFRALGSLARSSELRHDPGFMDRFVNEQGPLSVAAANRVEVWMERVVTLLDNIHTTGILGQHS